jgi:hypothetical protein
MNALERQVLEIIGEDPDAPDVFVDTDAGMAPIRDSLNDAIQEITIVTGAKIAKYYLPMRQEQMFYRFALNDGYLGWVVDAWSINQRYRLEQTSQGRLSVHDPRWMVTNGEPRSYFQIGQDVVGFWPKPSSDSNTIELTVVEIPKPYTNDADRVNLRDELQYAAVHYAVAEYWASRGDANEAAVHYGFYTSALGLKESITNKAGAPRLATAKETPRETN